METTYALGVDPGTTTGMAVVRFLEDALPEPIWRDQLPWDDATDMVVKWLRRMHALSDRTVAIGEKFTINANTAKRGQEGARDAMGMLGVLRRECRLSGVPMAPLQQRGDAEALVGDNALRNLKLYGPGEVHANDACRHVIFWALKNNVVSGRQILKAGIK
jgi:hypothetical protein